MLAAAGAAAARERAREGAVNVEMHVDVAAPRQAVWAVTTDIENAADTIRAIERVEILERPAEGLVGLRWRETRTIFGKTATEVMWITEEVPGVRYRTRAESHGFVYVSALIVADHEGGTRLTMTHESTPQTLLARLMLLPMLLFKGAMRKAIAQDLADIKARAERSGG